jgi:hypothetical protein
MEVSLYVCIIVLVFSVEDFIFWLVRKVYILCVWVTMVALLCVEGVVSAGHSEGVVNEFVEILRV